MIEATKTWDLKVPVEFGGETVAKVTLRRPKGREIRNLRNRASAEPGIAGDLTVQMMANLAEREEGLFDEMDGIDFRAIEGWLEKLLGN